MGWFSKKTIDNDEDNYLCTIIPETIRISKRITELELEGKSLEEIKKDINSYAYSYNIPKAVVSIAILESGLIKREWK